jgi:hypothetical protein
VENVPGVSRPGTPFIARKYLTPSRTKVRGRAQKCAGRLRIRRESSIGQQAGTKGWLRASVVKTSYKRECQETFLSVGSVPTLFLSRHSAQSFECALAIGEWSSSDDVVSCFVSSHETVRSPLPPVVPFHCRDGAHSFLETDKHNDCRIANHGPIVSVRSVTSGQIMLS